LTVCPATAAPSWPSSPTARTAVVATSTGPALPSASSGVAHPAGGGVAAFGFFAPGRLAASARLAFRLAGAPACAAAFVDAAALGSAFARGEVFLGAALAVAFGAALGAALAVAFGAALGAALAVAFGPALPLAFARADGALADDFAFAAVFALGEAFFARGFAVSAGAAAAATASAASVVEEASPAGLPRLALRRVGRDRGRLERTSRWDHQPLVRAFCRTMQRKVCPTDALID
jgi:hypothetical protein